MSPCRQTDGWGGVYGRSDFWKGFFTCVSYAEARNRYRLDVRLSVCPSVCPSVTRWHCIKTVEHIVMLSSPHDSPFILVLCVSRYSRNSYGVTPCGGAKQRWGMIKTAISEKRRVDQSIDTTCYQLSATVDCDQHTRDHSPCIYR